MNSLKIVKGFLYGLLVVILLVNLLVAFHAYKFTHFSAHGTQMEKIHPGTMQKMKILVTGVDNPRPVNDVLPQHPYSTVYIQSNVQLQCWHMPTLMQAKGTIILFHGYTSNKSNILDRAEVFLQNGYNCLLVDFMGSGGSGGNETTIGYKEADEVVACYKYMQQHGEQHIYLYGSSMGAVAIMKAIKDDSIKPAGIIIECPFATMYETVCARFRMLHVPAFPMAGIMVLWGGLENGFWGFGHNPEEYARYIHCPVLLQYGAKDDRVGRLEIDTIFAHISAPKKLVVYPLSGHDDYLVNSKEAWSKNVIEFLNSLNR